MSRQLLLAALLATLLLCAALAMREDDEIVAVRPQRLTRNERAVAGEDAANRLRAAAKASRDAAWQRGAWPGVASTVVLAWAGVETAASAPPAAALTQRSPAAVVGAAQPPLPPPAPPPARAPASGFELIGTLVEGATRSALIQTAQRSLWVRPGDTVEGAWRVEQVQADSVDLLWLPQQLPAALRYRTP